MTYDALVVGGGAAGLSAALVLGRARRSVIVIDDGNPRNAVAPETHGFLTRDGMPPAEVTRLARAELAAYPTVELLSDTVRTATKIGDVFSLQVESGVSVSGKRLLMATGVFDELPPIDGLRERWGKSVFVCPFCDGWEIQDQRIAVYGPGRDAVELAQEVHGWTNDLIVCVERDDLAEDDRRWIAAARATLSVGTIRALSGPPEGPQTIAFADGRTVECHAMFISAPLRQHSPLYAALGCEIGDDGLVVTSHCLTTIAGCYAAGDAVTNHHQLVLSAASGAEAAIVLNSNLLEAEAAALAASGTEPVL